MKNKEKLSAIYEEVLNELPPTQKYKSMQSNLVDETNKFLKVVGEQNRQALENLYDTIYAMGKEEGKQLFFEGFSYPVKLFIEAMSKD